ncbi:MAG: insulinase family protein [Thermodesulfobacteriota bacterium]|nr:MAG: insulinase family protein [Thermodesulfobacteriota bacterium]
MTEDIKKGFSSDLVEAAKHHEVAEAEFQKNSVSGLAMLWSQVLAVEGRQSPEEGLKAIEDVTVADVNRVARKYMDFDHAIVAILTPEVSGKPISSQGFGGVESFAPQRTKAVKLPYWAENALKRLSIPASSLNPQETTLSNGIKLIVQPVSVSNTISVYGHVKNQPDMEVAKGQEGVQLVLEQLFSYGTKSLDRLAFQKSLDDIGANASAGTDFSLQVLIDQFDRGTELLADNVLHPALPESAFKTVQKQVADTVAGQLQSPDYLAGRALKTALFPKHDPTLRQATPVSIAALNLKDIKGYYEKVFRPDLTTIVVIGKVTPGKAKEVIEKYFGNWKSTGYKPDTLLPAVPLNKPSTILVPDASRVQDEVILAETIDLNRSNPDYYALALGNHILGGGFYATRLYQDLREKTGLVYFVSSDFDVGKTRGLYIVKYGCDPPNVSKARSIIKQNLQEMQNSLVGPGQLTQAKAMLLRQIPLSESGVSNIAKGFISRVDLDLPLDEPILAARRYVKLNAEHVKSAFVKYVRPDDLVQITQGPKPQ